MRILLLDDHRLFRSGLKLLLERAPGFEVVAEVGSAKEVFEHLGEACPDVIVIDIHLPGALDGIEVARQLRLRCAEVKIVFLSSDGDYGLVRRAIEAGGNGYLLKDSAPAQLVRALEAVQMGGLYLCPEVAAAVAENLPRREERAAPAEKPRLSEREQEVLRAIVEGLRNKEIAARLGVSTKSVETYRTRLLTKLGYTSTAELVRYAVRAGLISP